jgi:hypothetical protein
VRDESGGDPEENLNAEDAEESAEGAERCERNAETAYDDVSRREALIGTKLARGMGSA